MSLNFAREEGGCGRLSYGTIAGNTVDPVLFAEGGQHLFCLHITLQFMKL